MAEKKTTLDILNEIRDLRNQELINQKDNRVFYTTAISLEKGETGQQIYRIMEEYSIGENQSLVRELFYKYEDKPELIAVIDPEKFEDNQIHQPAGIEPMTEEEKADWNLLVKDIEEGRIRAEEKIKDTALKLGISEQEIEGLAEIDVDKIVFERMNEINNQNEAKKEYNADNKETEAPFNITKQDVRRLGIVGMNTMPLNQKVGVHGESLKEELGLSNKEQYADVDSIEIIPTYKLANLGYKVQDTPFVAVARHRDGSIEAFPESICKIYKGENNEITKIDGQKDEVTKEKANTIMQFAGKNTSIAINQKSPYGIVEASLAYNTRDNNGRVALTLQDKYDGKDQNDYAARQIVDSHHGTEHLREVVEEGNTHPEGEKIERKDADGDKNTGHIYFDSDSQEQQNAIVEIMDEGKVSKEEAKRLFVKYLEDRENKEEGQERIDYAKNMAIEDVNYQARGNRGGKREN